MFLNNPLDNSILTVGKNTSVYPTSVSPREPFYLPKDISRVVGKLRIDWGRLLRRSVYLKVSHGCIAL